MLLILGAVVAGILIGLALGGSLDSLAGIRFRWWPLALIGLAMQLIPVPALRGQADHWLSVALLSGSYGVLLLFVALNLRFRGFALVGLGFALNFLVISLNGGMPVNDHALRLAYGSDYSNTVADLRANGGEKHHLSRPGDVLLPLSDVIPVGGVVHNVFSPGDVLSMVGIAWVLAEGAIGRRERRPLGTLEA